MHGVNFQDETESRSILTKFAQWRYVSAGIRSLLRYFAAYCKVVSLILVGMTSRAGYVGENYVQKGDLMLHD